MSQRMFGRFAGASAARADTSAIVAARRKKTMRGDVFIAGDFTKALPRRKDRAWRARRLWSLVKTVRASAAGRLPDDSRRGCHGRRASRLPIVEVRQASRLPSMTDWNSVV